MRSVGNREENLKISIDNPGGEIIVNDYVSWLLNVVNLGFQLRVILYIVVRNELFIMLDVKLNHTTPFYSLRIS